jgi:hypothetical protein
MEGRGAVAAPNAGIFFLRDHLKKLDIQSAARVRQNIHQFQSRLAAVGQIRVMVNGGRHPPDDSPQFPGLDLVVSQVLYPRGKEG